MFICECLFYQMLYSSPNSDSGENKHIIQLASSVMRGSILFSRKSFPFCVYWWQTLDKDWWAGCSCGISRRRKIQQPFCFCRLWRLAVIYTGEISLHFDPPSQDSCLNLPPSVGISRWLLLVFPSELCFSLCSKKKLPDVSIEAIVASSQYIIFIETVKSWRTFVSPHVW